MSTSQKQKAKPIVLLIGLVFILAIVYVAVSYQNDKRKQKSASMSRQETTMKELSVVEILSQNSSDESSEKSPPSLGSNTMMPANVPPEMIKALEARGMTVEDLQNMSKENQGSMVDSSQFPEAMQKAMAARNSQSASQDTMAKNADGLPSFVTRAVNHIYNHKSKELTAVVDASLDSLAKNPQDVDALLTLSILFSEHNEMPGAKYLLEEAVNAEPDNAHVAYVYGSILAKNFESEEAAKQWEHSLSIEENPQIRFDLARLYRYQLNKPELAKEYLAKAKSFSGISSSLAGQIQREMDR